MAAALQQQADCERLEFSPAGPGSGYYGVPYHQHCRADQEAVETGKDPLRIIAINVSRRESLANGLLELILEAEPGWSADATAAVA